LVSDTLEEGITPHKAPRVLQTLLWISTIAAGTPHQLIFAGEAPIPMGQLPWGGAGSHPERSFWGSKGSMPLYAAMESYAAQMRVILPSISAPFGLPQPNVTVRAKKILLPPTGVKGWAGGESLTARAWRQAPDLVPNSSYCGHVVVANGAEQSAQSFTLQLGGSFPVNSTWWSMRVVRMFEADYAITVSSSGTFSDYIDAAATHVYQIGDCGDKEPPPPPAVCTPSPVALGCYNVSGLWCYNDTRTSAGWRHDPNRGCVLGKSASHVHPCFCRLRAHSRAHASVAGSVEDFAKDKKLSLERCAGQCNHWQPERKDKVEVLPLLGVLDGKACFCGDQAQLALATAKARARPLEECVLVSCSGASNEKCGGVDRLAVFNYSVTPGVSPWLPHV
jgi:hypothetical protein